MAHLDWPINELYSPQRLVQIIEEVPEEELLEHAEIKWQRWTSLEVSSTADSESVPTEYVVHQLRDKKDEDTNLYIVPSVSYCSTVTKDEIDTLRHEGI